MAQHALGPQMPSGFVDVTRERFFSLLNEAAAVDPMPRHDSPDYTTWETQRGPRVTWGWSTPGWRNPGESRRYAVLASVAKARA